MLRFFNLVTLVFVALKLTNYIAWSWWLVISPTLLGLTICAVIPLIFIINMFLNTRK